MRRMGAEAGGGCLGGPSPPPFWTRHPNTHVRELACPYFKGRGDPEDWENSPTAYGQPDNSPCVHAYPCCPSPGRRPGRDGTPLYSGVASRGTVAGHAPRTEEVRGQPGSEFSGWLVLPQIEANRSIGTIWLGGP
eukprot:gene25432-biopygen20988